jgi:trans-AT polyketide synthase, acyltransferase and oxidoreductase domains
MIRPERVMTEAEARFDADGVTSAATRFREVVHVVRERTSGRLGVAWRRVAPGLDLLASLPPLYPEWLGDRGFCDTHGVRFPYVAGEMANGIATPQLVVEMAKAEMLGFFGAAGLALDDVERGLVAIEGALPNTTAAWGANLIHSPSEPELEQRVAELFIRRNVPRVSASAYMQLTPALVHVAYAGVRQDSAGRIRRPRAIFAKLSRSEVAKRFLSPAPPALLRVLVERGALTQDEVRLAAHLPVAEDVTAEADSGGHTDHRPLSVLLPEVAHVRDTVAAQHGYARPIRVGAAGGLGTPAALAAAFALGADYVLTGSVNQASVESGLSDAGKAMLAAADMTDVAVAPAADMFELGITVQVLARGSMFAARGRRLWDLFSRYDSIDAIPAADRKRLETEVLGASLEQVWEETRVFWSRRDASQLERAERDPRHRMALVFRWYLGSSSHWAIDGTPSRRADYQIWCGPAMGAFNAWVAGTFLAEPKSRSVVQIALNLLEGAAQITRARQLKTAGLSVPPEAFRFQPRRLC